jgi:glycosyltransferase involved in cell wall biosynthesis
VINILLYTDTPQIGGAELQMFLLAKFLNKTVFTPILACSNFPALDKWCEKFEKESIKVIRLNVKHKHDPRHFIQLKKIIKSEKINLLHAHVWNPASCRYAFNAAKNISIITTEHDPFKLPLIKNLFKKRTLKKVAKIIAISENNKKLLENLYPEHKNKIQVIHNGIDTTWWQSQLLRITEEDINKIKTQTFHAKKDTLIIATIAELHERKGLKYLIQAIPEITQKFPNIKLIIIGEGSQRDFLERVIKKLEIRNHVELLGHRKDIAKLLKSSNIFCLPSRREGFGLVNLEAMMIPLPIVATSVGGIPEIVQNEKTGLLVEPENSEALAKALIQLIGSSELRKKMAEAGFDRVTNHFDAKKMAEEYEKTYNSVISS